MIFLDFMQATAELLVALTHFLTVPLSGEPEGQLTARFEAFKSIISQSFLASFISEFSHLAQSGAVNQPTILAVVHFTSVVAETVLVEIAHLPKKTKVLHHFFK